jgi:hypothetical protein
MNETTPSPNPAKASPHSATLKSLRTIAIGYGVVALFLGVFIAAITLGGRMNKALGEPRWAFVLALVAILPLFLPAIITYVLPHISALKISSLVELSFAKAEVASYSLADLGAELASNLTGETTAPQFASMMTSFSIVIVETIQTARKKGDRVVVVDLGDGAKWIPPNLFILAMLARNYTSIQLIGFTETRKSPSCFVGMSSPAEIVNQLGIRFPALAEAASDYQNLDQPPGMIASNFFHTLSAIYQKSPEVMTVKDMWLNGPLLIRLLGPSIYSDHVEWEEPLPESSSHYILLSPHLYVAAVNDEVLKFFIERDQFALLAARQMIQPHR